MIGHPSFPVEPWVLRETALDLDVLAQSESVFALSNGHIGWRGNLDEGEPHGIPGSYLNGVYERRPLPYAEVGYGYPENGQTIINVTNGKVIRLLVDDEPFDVRYGHLRAHERGLDFRARVLRREVEWVSPADRAVRVSSARLVSLSQRAVEAIAYEVEPVDAAIKVVVQSELIANEDLPLLQGDPRTGATLPDPLLERADAARGARGGLVHATRHTAQCIAAVMDPVVDGPPSTLVQSESFPDLARTTVMVRLEPGQRLRLVKYVAYGWSASRSSAAVRDQADAALGQAVKTAWDGLLGEQRAYLDDLRDRADVELDGDAEVQQAVRFGLFHVLQAGARAEGRAIPAKGRTGPGYNGHAFWDSEAFVLPVLTYTVPEAAAHALRWRHGTLPSAKERAAQLGLAGATFRWRTIAGVECSSYWSAGTAAFHLGADIPDAVTRYVAATGDANFERTVALELLTETARLWYSLGHHDGQGRFRIDGVTGPVEYSAVADNNVYTNLMAQHNLRAAADAAQRHPDAARGLGVDEEETAGWRDAAEAMYVPYDEALGVHPQSEGFTVHQPWDFAATTPEQYPLLLHFPYFDLYRKQASKQAGLVLAMHLRGHAGAWPKRRLATSPTTSGSRCGTRRCPRAPRLSWPARPGTSQQAHDYLAEAALLDMDDLEHNTRDGLHIASFAGAWIALAAGFGGLREHESTLAFAPSLPPALTRIGFTITFRNRRLHVEVAPATVTYQLRSGQPLQIFHEKESVTVSKESPLRCALTRRPGLEPPTQPFGRAPATRRARDASS